MILWKTQTHIKVKFNKGPHLIITSHRQEPSQEAAQLYMKIHGCLISWSARCYSYSQLYISIFWYGQGTYCLYLHIWGCKPLLQNLLQIFFITKISGVLPWCPTWTLFLVPLSIICVFTAWILNWLFTYAPQLKRYLFPYSGTKLENSLIWFSKKICGWKVNLYSAAESW